MLKRISRKTFLKGLLGLSLATLSGKVAIDLLKSKRKIPCRLYGPNMSLGHKLRDSDFSHKSVTAGSDPEPEEGTVLKQAVTIIGGGIAGLSAGWWLKRNGFTDFKILELENDVGGNSAAGKNKLGRFPWGAHYVPLANSESEYVRLIFEELGIIEGFDKNEKPLYNELFLCHDPQERLLKDGKFQEGLVPNRGLSKKDRADVDRFFKIIRTYREKIGRDGKPAFAIPLDLSSQDPEYVELDNISMADWMAKNDFSTKPINWYVRYCCRDDYGANPDSVSAWAGIHYFAGRRGTAGNAAQNSVVTWPEGNGYIVDKLKTQLADHILTSAMATAIEQKDGQVKTRFFQPGDNRYGQALCDYLVFCAPRFVADHVIKNEPESRIGNLDYAPWLVANISLSSIPSSNGVELSWDNVSYYSESLGYVVSTHQSITTRVDGPTVITYYFPLTSDKPAIERQRLLSTNKEIWAELIVKDLEKMHPGIKENIQNIDLWPWGHGMIQPSPGFLFSESRKQMLLDCGRIIFAHSDMSGISNFEEAQYRGVEAAKKILSLART